MPFWQCSRKGRDGCALLIWMGGTTSMYSIASTRNKFFKNLTLNDSSKNIFQQNFFFSDASPLVWYFKATRTRQSVIGGSPDRSFHLFSLLHNWILFPIGGTLIGLFGLSGNLGTNNFTNCIYFGCIKSICMHKWSGIFFGFILFSPLHFNKIYIFTLGFNNYVNKMRGEGVKKCLFLSTLKV